jgi:hypothetical protein
LAARQGGGRADCVAAEKRPRRRDLRAERRDGRRGAPRGREARDRSTRWTSSTTRRGSRRR